MAVLFSVREKCYCAFCRSPKKIYKHRRLGWKHALISIVASLAMMAGLFQQFHPSLLFFLPVTMLICDVFLQIRWRLSVVCKRCGFDPVLYVKDSSLAAEKVRTVLEKRREDPTMILASPLHLPKITKDRAELLKDAELGKKGGLVSRQV